MTRLEYFKLQSSGFRALFFRSATRTWRLRFLILAGWISTGLSFYTIGVLLGKVIPGSIPFSRQIIPGILSTYVINTCLQDGCFNLFIQRFNNEVKSILTSPITTSTTILAFIAGACFRATVGFTGVYMMTWLLADSAILYPLQFFALLLNSAIFFSMMGIKSGIDCKDFTDAGVIEGLIVNIGQSLGGGLYSINLIDNVFIKNIVRCNPFYYLISSFKHFFWGDTAFIPFSGLNLLLFIINILLFVLLTRHYDRSKNIRS
jgi:ABC-type polysaccharide/polyol phosphate export permease